jgi:hypothetical protein
LISTSSSSWSLITMNVGARGKKVCQRPCNVSSSPFSIMATRCKASRIFLSTFLPSLEFSLDSWNIGGCVDASGSM